MLLLGHLGITLGVAWMMERRFRIDYRLIVLGSLLPDILDKTFGIVIFSTGRALAHSILFILLLSFLATWKRSFAYIAFASFLHLLQDEMWRSSTFYFPYTELEVKQVELTNFFVKFAKSYFILSKTFIFEVFGATILILFVLFRLKGVKRLKVAFKKSK